MHIRNNLIASFVRFTVLLNPRLGWLGIFSQAAAAPVTEETESVKSEDTRMIKTSGKPKTQRRPSAQATKKAPTSREEQPIGLGNGV